MPVGLWRWMLCKSRAGEDMLRVTYQRSFTDPKEINEYFLLWRNDIIGVKAQRLFLDIARRAHVEPTDYDTINEVIAALNESETKPVAVEYRYQGRYANVTDRIWRPENV